jgi:hypothetical protein
VRLPRLGALLAAQASLIALPDELLRSILRRAWAERPPHGAAGEVCRAANLALVCRRVRELLRAQPLPLALDFSAARLHAAQRRWLLEPAQAGRVEAASFHTEDALWEQPLFGNFLALHGGTLLHLSGMPLQLVARASQAEGPALDMSSLRLTKLGMNCNLHDLLGPRDWNSTPWPPHVCLWPERLPGTLEELDLLGLESSWLTFLAWAPESSAGLAGRLPWLQTLSCTSKAYDAGSSVISNVPLLEGLTSLPHFEVAGMNIDLCSATFDPFRSVRIVARGHLCVYASMNEDMAMFVDHLCHAGLQAAELCTEHSYIQLRPDSTTSTPQVVHAMIDTHGDRFAIEVGIRDKALGPWHMSMLQRLAWRRWPAPGAPDLPAARAAHERARAWAAEGGQRHLLQ